MRLEIGEPVGVPNRWTDNDFDAGVEVAGELANHRALLRVLLPEVGSVGQTGDQQLGDNQRDPVEMARAARPLEPVAERPGDVDPGHEAGRVHGLDGSGRTRRAPRRGEHRQVGVHASGGSGRSPRVGPN